MTTNVWRAFFWLLRTGARWRNIPVDLPSGCTCWRRLHEWSGEGILEKIHSALIEELGELGQLHLKDLVMDATFIRPKKKGHEIGITKCGKGMEFEIVADASGLPLDGRAV